jgi:uncharacterized protein YjbJ (UPF0337 family)
MNWDMIKGNWKQMKGDLKKVWGELTDDDLASINGDKDRLIGVLQERYGIARNEAERQARDAFRD